MVIILMLFTYVVNVIFDFIEGTREAIFFSWINYGGGMPKKDNKHLHQFFLIARTFMGLVTVTPLLYIMRYNLQAWVLFTLSLPLAFVYWHDGAYYLRRNILNPSVYPLKFKAQSTTSLAWTDKFMSYEIRMALFICSLICLILSIIIITKTF